MDHIIKLHDDPIHQSKESLISFSFDPKVRNFNQRDIASDVRSIRKKHDSKFKIKDANIKKKTEKHVIDNQKDIKDAPTKQANLNNSMSATKANDESKEINSMN